MKRYQTAAVLLSLLAVPACSQLGMHMPGSQTTASAGGAAPMAHAEIAPDMVKQVQTSLQQQGLYHGGIDGVWGPATVQAVQSYQQKNNLNANGQLDEATLKSLNMGGGMASGAMPASSGTPGTPPAPPAASSPAVSSGANSAAPPPPPPPPAGTNQ
jgi:hypothetical protein